MTAHLSCTKCLKPTFRLISRSSNPKHVVTPFQLQHLQDTSPHSGKNQKILSKATSKPSTTHAGHLMADLLTSLVDQVGHILQSVRKQSLKQFQQQMLKMLLPAKACSWACVRFILNTLCLTPESSQSFFSFIQNKPLLQYCWRHPMGPCKHFRNPTGAVPINHELVSASLCLKNKTTTKDKSRQTHGSFQQPAQPLRTPYPTFKPHS